MIEEKGGEDRLKILNILKIGIKRFQKIRLEKSIEWEIAIVKKINQFNSIIETENNSKGIIKYKDISWTKKEFTELFKLGDIIYVKKIDTKSYSLQQLPKINGGIVVMDPFTGRVLA